MKIEHKLLMIPLVMLLALLVMGQTPSQQTAQTAVTLSWGISPSTNIVSQTIGWGTSHGNYTQFLNLAPNVQTIQLSGLTPAITYFVAVRATQGLGAYGTNLVNSDWGPELLVTTYPTSKPLPPTMPRVVSQP